MRKQKLVKFRLEDLRFTTQRKICLFEKGKELPMSQDNYIDRYDVFEDLQRNFGSAVGVQISTRCNVLFCSYHDMNKFHKDQINSISEFKFKKERERFVHHIKTVYPGNYIFTFVDNSNTTTSVLFLDTCPSYLKELCGLFIDSITSTRMESDPDLRIVKFFR